jgi:translation initiation factor 3 subunit F
MKFTLFENNPQYKIHPVVLCNIFDSYIRRSDKQERLIGTLLGEKHQDYTEIKNCYPVPIKESQDKVVVSIEFHNSMFELYKMNNPNDEIVGWYLLF